MAEESSKRKRGRRKGQTKHPVHELFEYDEDLDESRCTVGTCNKKIPKNHAGNLMSHLEAHHKEVHANTSAKADEVFGRPDRNAPKRAKRTVLNGVKMSGPALELHSLRLITEGGLSFKALDYPAFKDIIQPMIDAMPRADQPTISSDTTPQKINGFAERVRQKMIQEMEDKMVSVKVDGCTKSTRHFIGVNVQYVHEGKTVVRTLAVEELFISSTGTNLKAIITRILRKYGIPVKAVVSFTSDNGANYILAGKLLGLDEAEEMMAEFEEPLESWAEGVELTQDDFHLQSVRCAEHTLQLAVDDACKSDEEFRPLLTSVKKLCNFLLELWLRVQRRRGVQFEETDAEDEENPDEPMAMALDDSEDEGVVDFKRFLERQNHTRLTRGGPANAPSSWSWKEKLRAKLDDYDRVVKPLPVTANVITYWEGKKLIWPELAELALIVLSIPATQVSVERLFSSLRFILRPQRHHLSAGNIDDVILLHTNPDIVKKLCEELQMLQTSSSGSNSTEDNSMQDTQETRSRSSSSSSLLSP